MNEDKDEIQDLITLIKDSYDVVIYETPNSVVSLTDQQRAFIVKWLEKAKHDASASE